MTLPLVLKHVKERPEMYFHKVEFDVVKTRRWCMARKKVCIC